AMGVDAQGIAFLQVVSCEPCRSRNQRRLRSQVSHKNSWGVVRSGPVVDCISHFPPIRRNVKTIISASRQASKAFPVRADCRQLSGALVPFNVEPENNTV